MERYLLELVYRGVINERQFDLLRETRVRRRLTQAQWGEARGVPHATVRTWATRAEAAVRACYEGHRGQEGVV